MAVVVKKTPPGGPERGSMFWVRIRSDAHGGAYIRQLVDAVDSADHVRNVDLVDRGAVEVVAVIREVHHVFVIRLLAGLHGARGDRADTAAARDEDGLDGAVEILEGAFQVRGEVGSADHAPKRKGIGTHIVQLELELHLFLPHVDGQTGVETAGHVVLGLDGEDRGSHFLGVAGVAETVDEESEVAKDAIGGAHVTKGCWRNRWLKWGRPG